MSKRNRESLPFDTIRLEGGLFVPDLLEKIARGDHIGQKEEDYHLPKGIRLHDEYGRAFQIASAQWKAVAVMFDRADIDQLAVTLQFVQELLQDVLGFPLEQSRSFTIADRTYRIPFLACGRVPIVVAPNDMGLDEVAPLFVIEGSGSKKRSASRMAQEFLNASVECTWALVTNGRRIRLLRDAATLTRPSYLEFDLETIFSDNRYPDFAAFWRILHQSRAGKVGTPGTSCIWEQWRLEGQAQGTRVRENLRYGVTTALEFLGNGFLQHPANEELRGKLNDGLLDSRTFFQELLRLVYRCLFLFTLEERVDERTEISLLHPPDTSPEASKARDIYLDGYSMKRLRNRVLRRTGYDRHTDLWQGMAIVFRALYHGEPRLALPALGGLFNPEQCPNLDTASLSNRALLEAIAALRWAIIDGKIAPVDYGNLGPEELGSVYESLLELVPDVNLPARLFGFIGLGVEGDTSGHARKISGSYYTPDSLVQELIQSALIPVIDSRLAEKPENPVDALLSITVIDPACGSGHFLLAAARRLAERLTELRAIDGAIHPEDYRHSLREVITSCIFGVDKNPLALELARFTLWLEGFEPGRPLSFLNHHLVCGDALVGLMEFRQLQQGIPKEAFKALSGDDADTCRTLGQSNRQSLKILEKRRRAGYMYPQQEQQANRDRLLAIEKMPAATVDEIETKAAAYNAFVLESADNALRRAADCYLGAFLSRKTKGEVLAPTTADLLIELYAEPADANHPQRLQAAQKICQDNQVLHWPLVFPQIFEKGGFDCVLANPPWEVSQLGEEEYFAQRSPDIAKLAGEKRKQAILGLREVAPRLFADYETEKHRYEALNTFYRISSRFPLTATGKINTYALFSETISYLINTTGRAGFIVPTGIATDDSTKHYFSSIIQLGRLISLLDFENRDAIFPGVHRSYKFCLLTLGTSDEAHFSFFLTRTEQLADKERGFSLRPEDFLRINPNTGTCPIFRSRQDAELTRKIYRKVPILIREAQGEDNHAKPEENPWGVFFKQGLFNMTSDSHLFSDTERPEHLPLYEAKMIHQFDHRWASYMSNEDGSVATFDVPPVMKADPHYAVRPRYWVKTRDVYLRISTLPKPLIKALQENKAEGIILELGRLLFCQWLHRQGISQAPEVLPKLFPFWQNFVSEHAFAAEIAPTDVFQCGKKPVGRVEYGPHCLPDLPTVNLKDQTKVAWYVAAPQALQDLLDLAATAPPCLEIAPTLSSAEEALAYAEILLEKTSPRWLMGWRDICRATDERTVIASVVPRMGTGDTLLLMFPDLTHGRRLAGLLADQCSLVHDFVARQKVGGTHLKYHVKKQIPNLPPDAYDDPDLSYIVPRVLELTYTSNDLCSWAKGLGYSGPPFPFDPDRRALIRAELDAYYARLYGLTRDELRYILDPADVMGDDYPSETFRVLKNNEIRLYGEYRTQRLVLEAWDFLEDKYGSC